MVVFRKSCTKIQEVVDIHSMFTGANFTSANEVMQSRLIRAMNMGSIAP